MYVPHSPQISNQSQAILTVSVGRWALGARSNVVWSKQLHAGTHCQHRARPFRHEAYPWLAVIIALAKIRARQLPVGCMIDTDEQC